MKSSEFIREIKKKGWVFVRHGKGSHDIYAKDDRQASVPNHGSKEMAKGTELKLRKEMGL